MPPTTACSRRGRRRGRPRSSTPCSRAPAAVMPRRTSRRSPISTRLARRPSRRTPALLDAFDAATAGREHLYDRARAAFERAKAGLAGTPLLREVERIAFERTGRETVAFDCDGKRPPTGRASRAITRTSPSAIARAPSASSSGCARSPARRSSISRSPRATRSRSATSPSAASLLERDEPRRSPALDALRHQGQEPRCRTSCASRPSRVTRPPRCPGSFAPRATTRSRPSRVSPSA